MKFGDCTYLEIKKKAATALAVLPTGCTEQQGPHLPVDFDTWFAETLCLAAAERMERDGGVDVLVLPAFPFGPTFEHRNYGSGYVDLPQALHEQVVGAALGSLADQGFRRIAVWRGCGGHQLDGVVAGFNDAHAGRSHAFLPELPYYDIWCRIGDPAIPGGHADSFTTSIALHLRPEAVRKAEIYDPRSTPVDDFHAPDLDFAAHSSSGVIGDPTHASAELGEQLWNACVEEVARAFATITETDI